MTSDQLTASIISSFSVFGKAEDDMAFPPDCAFVEVYAFMHQSLSGTSRGEKSVVQYLSELYLQGAGHIVEAEVLKRFAGKRIVALATFMPEISAELRDNSYVTNSINALKLLIDMARSLNQKGHPIQTIELVAGSRVQGILKTDSPKEKFYMHRQYPSRALSLLVDRLKEVAADALKPPTIYLSVQLEPGPLFVLSQAETVKRFCALIDQSSDKALRRCVGVNLGIPYWDFLAGIQPEWLLSEENRAVLMRIVHAHVSDHNIGHFSDASVPTYPGHEARFKRWFSLLKILHDMKRLDDYPEFSGYVSCEMEACKEASYVQLCYHNVVSLLKNSRLAFITPIDETKTRASSLKSESNTGLATGTSSTHRPSLGTA